MRKRWLIGWIGLLILPALARGQIAVSELSQEWVVTPGQIYQGGIEVQNLSEEPAAVEIYQSDYCFYADGRSEYPPPGKLPRSNAGWITLELASPRITIPPKSSVTVPYTIRVPEDPNLVGTYWSVVNVRFSSPGPPMEGLVIRHVFEYGVQIVTDIGDTGRRDIRVIGSKLIEREDGLSFQLDLENTGERWLRPIVWLEVYDKEGNFVGRFESGRLRIYPGTSVRHRIPLPILEPGSYPALLIIDNLDEYVWGAQVTLEVR